ncbi:MAG: IS3 family transposase [Pseudonocardia sp.]|nr:IS3 family transposase [Pseudonocardia sp.]
MRWLEVSPSGYYEWRDRRASATVQRRQRLAALIQAIFEESDSTYGYRRVHAALARQREHCGPELVRRSCVSGLGSVPARPVAADDHAARRRRRSGPGTWWDATSVRTRRAGNWSEISLIADLAGFRLPGYGPRLLHQRMHRIRDRRPHARRACHRRVAHGRA